ncbi:cobalamin biosynthesis protein CbiD [Treponema sp. JC4]|uniref:cobalt-precorrin-5B (C(1))-methyltransferase CbiD n=1 Tax=Treponema sp. JC4 TaxID=1124982 RepID=UPI00025B04AD|nr:cobalt-precorrin-5B (C(1))-methyltransferase CbiD [Treponema sp. JC4]EID85694.1 cobalamin biosynthesis protein CbiD [Treponema sp. JC4]
MAELRYGFTTGSCAAAGAKAAAYMLLTGKIKKEIKITTPKGIDFNAELVDIKRSEREISCAVIKDGGDDPDVTSGCHVVAKVSFAEKDDNADVPGDKAYSIAQVQIRGGLGVGLVTKPGLDQPVGNHAINSVPRQMIEKEVLEVCELCDYKGGLLVEISVPEGEEIAKKTFNPRLGIEGGISILGTSGIVEPMSSQALLDTIFIELRQQRELGSKIAVVSPGNYGLDFIKSEYGFDLDRAVKCSNFIGDTIDMAVKLGFEGFLLTGHIGKLIKVSGGIMNTHSKIADCRMELMAAAAVQAGAGSKTVSNILSAISTEEACKIIMSEDGLLQFTMQIVMKKILYHLRRRADSMHIECSTFCTQLGLLAESEGFRATLHEACR